MSRLSELFVFVMCLIHLSKGICVATESAALTTLLQSMKSVRKKYVDVRSCNGQRRCGTSAEKSMALNFVSSHTVVHSCRQENGHLSKIY